MTTTQLTTIRYHGLGLADMQVLTHLAEQGPLLMSELATAAGISAAAMTGTCQKLIGKLLIQRLRSRWTDGRYVIIELTELGRVRLHQITGKFPEPTPPRRIDCGSGHDYGICPVCGHGHGFLLKSSASPIPL